MRIASNHLAIAVTAILVICFFSPIASAEEVSLEYRASIAKGLEWLARKQEHDGHWEAAGGSYPEVMTALSGIALLMEGSTIREGKYRDNIRYAVDWFEQHSQSNGLIGSENSGGYMYGHGFAMLFLSSIVGEEEDSNRRRKLVDILDRAAKFSYYAQSSRGGWFYVSAKEGQDKDEGSVTVTQLQGLRAARNAGIVVPSEVIKNGIRYLRNATNAADGGVTYSLTLGGGYAGSRVLTAAAIVSSFSSGEYDSPLVKRWYKFCRAHLSDSLKGVRIGNHDDYTSYYYSQAIYMLGEDGWGKLFPEDKGGGLTWSGFRKASFDVLVRNQSDDGSWSGNLGPVYSTAISLCILQLDKAVLPIYQR